MNRVENNSGIRVSEQVVQTCGLLALPIEVLCYIIDIGLLPSDMALLSLTCKEIREISNADVIWRRLFKKNAPLPTRIKESCWKSVYRRYFSREGSFILSRYLKSRLIDPKMRPFLARPKRTIDVIALLLGGYPKLYQLPCVTVDCPTEFGLPDAYELISNSTWGTDGRGRKTLYLKYLDQKDRLIGVLSIQQIHEKKGDWAVVVSSRKRDFFRFNSPISRTTLNAGVLIQGGVITDQKLFNHLVSLIKLREDKFSYLDERRYHFL